MFGYDGVKDMFDGGGTGQSGTSFSGGGPLSSAANRVATPRGSRTSGGEMRPQGRPDMGAMMQRQQQKPSFLRDMFDGGGMGATGDSFQGAGGYSGLLNMLGIKPMGAQDRATLSSYMEALQAASQPQVQPRSTYTPPMPPATSMRPQMRPMASQGPNYSDRFSVPVPPQYSGRGSAGMPMASQGPNYSDRFSAPVPPQYSGRGSVGMPMPPFVSMTPNPEEAAGLVDYLRRAGVQGY